MTGSAAFGVAEAAGTGALFSAGRREAERLLEEGQRVWQELFGVGPAECALRRGGRGLIEQVRWDAFQGRAAKPVLLGGSSLGMGNPPHFSGAA